MRVIAVKSTFRSSDEGVEECGAVGLVAVTGVVALAKQDGDELGAGGEVGAGFADRLHAAVELGRAGAHSVAEHAGVGLVTQPDHGGGLDVGGQRARWDLSVEGVDVGVDFNPLVQGSRPWGAPRKRW